MIFWVIAALLAAFTALALMHTLLKGGDSKDKAIDSENRDTKHQKLGNLGLALGIAGWMCLTSLGGYLLLGSPQLIEQSPRQSPEDTAKALAEELVVPLQQAVDKNPGDIQKRHLLGVMLLTLDRLDEAENVFRELTLEKGVTQDTFARYAEVLILQNDGMISQQAKEALEESYLLQPESPRAIELVGDNLMGKRYFLAAKDIWVFLQSKGSLPEDMRKRVDSNLEKLKSLRP